MRTHFFASKIYTISNINGNLSDVPHYWCPAEIKHLSPLLGGSGLSGSRVQCVKHTWFPVTSHPNDLSTSPYLRPTFIYYMKYHKYHGIYAHSLFTKRAKLNIRKTAFPLIMVEPWNSLPKTAMQSKTLNTFKNRLDRFWSNQAILYDMI